MTSFSHFLYRKRNACTDLVRKYEGKNHLEDLGTDGTIILKWDLGKGWRN
jgi:hypothetical protein